MRVQLLKHFLETAVVNLIFSSKACLQIAPCILLTCVQNSRVQNQYMQKLKLLYTENFWKNFRCKTFI